MAHIIGITFVNRVMIITPVIHIKSFYAFRPLVHAVGNRNLTVRVRIALTHWRRDKMAAIFQTKFSDAFIKNENVWISIKILPKFVPKDSFNNIISFVQIMAWCQTGHKPLSEPSIGYFADAYMRHLTSMI